VGVQSSNSCKSVSGCASYVSFMWVEEKDDEEEKDDDEKEVGEDEK
jgi:hypothetical protein